jgi:gluconate:H+ symporter, GntP family
MGHPGTALTEPARVLTAATSTGHDVRLVIAALAGIAVLVLLVTLVKLHPLLALTLGALVVGAIAGENLNTTVESFSTGVGTTVASVGVFIALGAIVGRLLVDSGGADEIVDTIVGRASPAALPWAMAGVGALIGLPMFFEIGLVLLIPVILLVTRRSGLPLMRIGIPALAGLSVMHGLVPPHPGPLLAIDAVHADLGLTLGLGILVAIPTVAISGPLFSGVAARWVPVGAPELFLRSGTDTDSSTVSAGETAGTGAAAGHTGSGGASSASRPGGGASSVESPSATERTDASTEDAAGGRSAGGPTPTFGATLATMLLPVVLMLAKAIADITIDDTSNKTQIVLDFFGTPLIALLLAVLVAMYTLGRGAGLSLSNLSDSISGSFAPIAGITFIVAAGGGFKQVLVDSGISDVIRKAVEGSNLSALFLAWLVAVMIRLATGSATVATITASGILSGVATDLSTSHTALLVLAIGSGSLFFSHVNDAGFWLVKEYFGVTVGQNLKSWSIMETLISVTGIVLVLLLSLVI